MAFVFGLLSILSTTFGGLFAIRFKDKLHLILGLSAGTVMGAALFDLIPESIELAGESYDLNIVMLSIAAGFIGFMIFDRLFCLHSHGDDHCANPQHQRGVLGAGTFSFHSFLDGMGVGLAFKISPVVGWTVAIAVLAHNFSDGINTVGMILKNKGERKQAFRWLAIDAIAPALGVLAAQFITVEESILGLVLAVFAGFFLYIGASDLIPESHHHHPTFWTTFLTIFGMVLLYTIIHIAE